MTAEATRRALERRLDDPLADGLGQGGIALVGPDLPLEVLLASERPFGHLPWQTAGPTPWADRWLESSFPFWARSILEQWHAGVFDGIDTVVFSRADDASQRLYYYVRELQARGKLAGPSSGIFDIALAPRGTSLAHTAAAVAALMQRLDVGDEAVAGGIERANLLRRRFAAIERERSADGPLHERLARAALWTDPTSWIDDIVLPAPVSPGQRILLAGSMPVDARLHEAVEISGSCIVAEMHALAPGRLGPEIEPGAEPVARVLARHLRQASVGPRAFIDRAARVLARARAVHADAVLVWLTREDEALAWCVPSLRRALAAAGIPALVLPAARWQADDGTLSVITDFCRGCARATA